MADKLLKLWSHVRTLLRRGVEAILVLLGLYMIYSHEVHGGGTVGSLLTFGAGCALVAAGIAVALVRSRAPVVAIELEPSSDLAVALQQLGRNYDLLRQEAMHGFVLAAVTMVLGVLVILAGAGAKALGFVERGGDLAVVAGVVTEVASGAGFYVFKNTLDRLSATSDRLHETWRILAAFTQADRLPDREKAVVKVDLIRKLMA